MCCLAKCLFGALLGWVIFAVNLAAAGALLAGAFAPWATYSGKTAFGDTTFFVAGLGVVGSTASIPSGTTIAELANALAAANTASNTVPWTTPTTLNTVYTGMAFQVAAAASIVAYTVFTSLFCLCMLCCVCCHSPRFNLLIALAKAGVALVGVASMGSFFTQLDTALKALAVAPAGAGGALAAFIGTGSTTTKIALGALASVAGSTPGIGAGKGLGSLGVALLGLNVVLHLLLLVKCGGAHHHPEKEAPKQAGCCRK